MTRIEIKHHVLVGLVVGLHTNIDTISIIRAISLLLFYYFCVYLIIRFGNGE
jgi:hypothetical protein